MYATMKGTYKQITTMNDTGSGQAHLQLSHCEVKVLLHQHGAPDLTTPSSEQIYNLH